MRIVSLTCSNTEIVCALGLASMLVGIDDHSDFPKEITHLPRVGPDLTIDLDAVADLTPDLVLASLTVPGHEAVVAGCADRDLPFLAPEPTSLATMLDDVRTIAAALGHPQRGIDLAEQLESSLFGRGREDPNGPSILVEWWPRPVIAPGDESWVNDLIRLAGGRPTVEEPVKSRPVTQQEVAEWAPDASVICWCGVPFEKYKTSVVYQRPGWESVPAVARRQVHLISEAYLGRPGPRLVQGLDALCGIVDQLR